MQPHQSLLPVPYALSLYPGGVVSGGLPRPVFTFQRTGAGAGVKRVASNLGQAGLHGHATVADSSGVFGNNDAPGGVGVKGDSDSGIGGYFSSISGTALYAGSDTQALLPDGDVHIDGEVSWLTRTGYIAIPAAGFVPDDETSSFN